MMTFVWLIKREPKIAYVDTSKLLVGFSSSAKVAEEMKAEEDIFQKKLKMIQDSIKSIVESMSVEYNTAKVNRKKELQSMLSAENQRYNNYEYAETKRLAELNNKKLQSAMDKANIFVQEYGKKHHYDIIFATSNGNIVYAAQNTYDITEKIITGLNERYK
jgi:outer membrane protein